jgi:hypothetical protein
MAGSARGGAPRSGNRGLGPLANVPADLRREPRWVCWKLVERDGKRTKLPFDAKTGRMAKSTDPATWATFDVAVAAVGRIHADGVGFVFGADRAFTGLDLDHVMPGGRLMEEYRWVVEEAGTYCEVSPSGEGLHLIFRGSKPEGATRCKRTQADGVRVVEMYDHERYFTVTGNVFEGHSALAANPVVVEKAYRTWIEPEWGQAAAQVRLGGGGHGGGVAGGAAAVAGGVAALDDDELVRRMLASSKGEKIRALLDGDTSAYKGDHSGADMALCLELAFWCAGDAARMDAIFRRSGLMRDKWDYKRGSSTYGALTIERALSQCTERYEPRGARSAGGGAGARDQRSGGNAENKRSTDGTGTGKRGNPTGEAADEPAFDPDRAPSVECWRVTDDGALWHADQDGRLRQSITSTAPWVAMDLVDVDSGDRRALVRLRLPEGAVVERAFDRDVLLNQARVITALAPMGGNVSSANCKDVIRYLTDCERRLGRLRPRARSVTHLGWADGPLGAFMPYDMDGGEVRFDPSPDEAAKARPFLEPKGTLEEWVAGMAPMRDSSPAFRCVLAASFASPLVAIVGAQAFIVYLWGRSRSGKTPTLKAAGSVWGDPTEGADSYFRTFADTPKSIVRAAALLHDVPLIVDELQSKGSSAGQAGKRQAVEDLLYSLSIGHERGALNSDRSMMRVGSWKSLTIATGEIPIVGGSTQQGAANRTLELNAEPFDDVRAAQAMHHFVAEQYGTAGRTYVRLLRGNTRERYVGMLADMRRQVASLSPGHPQADNVALVALADALASFYVFGCRDWGACRGNALALAAWALGNATGADSGDTDLKAIQFVAEWLERSRLHFEGSAEMDRLDRWGEVEERPDRPGFLWWVFSHVLGKALEAEGFDRQKTLRRMDEEGLLVRGGSGRRFTRQRRIRGGSRIWCVCIDNTALEAFLARANSGSRSLDMSSASSLVLAGGDGGDDR